MASSNTIDSTTQKFLDIYDITNDLVILKDGTASVILTVDAMNFGLLAEEEQDSIMYAYAGLLNSLNYPIQIIIRSQTKDVTGYLRLIKEQEDAVLDRTQQKRIMKYREFVANLIRERNVLDKKFYITIPAKPLELGLVPVSSVVPGTSTTDVSTVDKSMLIEKARSILEPKRDHLIAQFARIGLYSRQLETQEIIQLFYQSYNPEAFEGQSMDDSKSYTAPLVSASIEGSSMNMQDQNQNQVAPVQESTTQAPTTPTATQTQPQDTLSETGVPPQPATNPGATPQAPAQPSTPTTNQADMQPQTQTPAQTQAQQPGGYTPTQMPAGQASPTPMQVEKMPAANTQETPMNVPPADEPAKPESNMQTNQPSDSATTPLPPAPELPKTQPGATDPAVPQETEITIQKPTEATTPESSTPEVTQPNATGTPPAPPAAVPQDTSSQPADGQNQDMAPLPEIK